MATLAMIMAMGGVAWAGVGSRGINDNSVQSIDVRNGTLRSVDYGSGSVGTADLGAGVVTSSKIADSAVTSAKVLDGTVGTADLGAGVVTSSTIADSAVTSAKVLDGTIVSSDIASGTIPIVMWARVGSAGAVEDSSAGVAAVRNGAGRYEVQFPQGVTDCAATVSTGNNNEAMGVALIDDEALFGSVDADEVFVITADDAGTDVDQEFNVIVAC